MKWSLWTLVVALVCVRLWAQEESVHPKTLYAGRGNVYKGGTTGEYRIRVLKTEDEWAQWNKEHKVFDTVPNVDFTKRMVLVICGGEGSGGNKVSLSNPIRKENRMVAELTREVVGTTEDFVCPLFVFECDKWDGTVHLRIKTITYTYTSAAAKSIGSARMEDDGTLVLQLRAEPGGGAVGDGIVRYPPDHPKYNEILKHIGGLKKGEEKPVPPWPDEKPKQ